ARRLEHQLQAPRSPLGDITDTIGHTRPTRSWDSPMRSHRSGRATPRSAQDSPSRTSVSPMTTYESSSRSSAHRRYRWYETLDDLGMNKAPTRKTEKRFTARGMKELEDFLTECNAFYRYNHAYFGILGKDHRRVLEAALHFDTALATKWEHFIADRSRL